MTGLKSWMEEVDTFLNAEEVAIGDLTVLSAQLDQSSVSFFYRLRTMMGPMVGLEPSLYKHLAKESLH